MVRVQDDRAKITFARALMDVAATAGHRFHVPVQALAELFNLLVRRGGRSNADTAAALTRISSAMRPLGTSPEIFLAAASLSAERRLQIFDAVILVAAAEAGCSHLFSEDFQDGFVWSGVTVLNPFLEKNRTRIEALLDPA